MGALSSIISNSLNTSAAPTGSSLANITNVVNTFVVAPLAAFGLGGFVFNAVGESNATLSADITDHYAEDNKAIQDQIAIRPKRITLKGYVGEIVYNGSGSAPSTINTLAEKLTSLSSYLPTITASATQAQQLLTSPATSSIQSVLGTTSNIYGLVQNILGAFGDFQNQQNAYTYFKALMQSGTLMGVQTPWEFMTNMAIENITAIQAENTEWITDFAVTYKEIRIAATSTALLSNASAAASGGPTPPAIGSTTNAQQGAPTSTLGSLSGTPSNVNLGATGTWGGATGSF